MKYERECCQLMLDCVIGHIEGLQDRYLDGLHGSENQS